MPLANTRAGLGGTTIMNTSRIHPTDGGEREAGEEGDDGDRDKEFDQREALQA